jgi:hypothetical protein
LRQPSIFCHPQPGICHGNLHQPLVSARIGQPQIVYYSQTQKGAQYITEIYTGLSTGHYSQKSLMSQTFGHKIYIRQRQDFTISNSIKTHLKFC